MALMNTGEILSVFCHNFQQIRLPHQMTFQNVGMRATDFQTHQAHHQPAPATLSPDTSDFLRQLCCGSTSAT
jgi:hypothetical protein